jgi:hypothetical protein
MKGEVKERWMELCEQAANEQDSQKLLELTKEIDRLLTEKEARLKTPDRVRDSHATSEFVRAAKERATVSGSSVSETSKSACARSARFVRLSVRTRLSLLDNTS